MRYVGRLMFRVVRLLRGRVRRWLDELDYLGLRSNPWREL
jgi:hypothetical protein